jgi:hypothetical protein
VFDASPEPHSAFLIICSLCFKMPDSTKKRTLDAFFKPPAKKARVLEDVKTSKGGNGQEQVSYLSQ